MQYINVVILGQIQEKNMQTPKQTKTLVFFWKVHVLLGK